MENARRTVAPETVTAMVPRTSFPRERGGTRMTQVATPPLSVRASTRARVLPTRAEQATLPPATTPPVSERVTRSRTTKRAPDLGRAGLDIGGALCLRLLELQVEHLAHALKAVVHALAQPDAVNGIDGEVNSTANVPAPTSASTSNAAVLNTGIYIDHPDSR